MVVNKIVRKSTFLTLLLILLTPSLCFGELRWDKIEAVIQATTSDTQAVAVYEFVNTGPNTVKITSMQSGCGDCSILELEKKEYASGEKGKLTAKFIFGQRVGVHQKTLTVLTDDPKQPRHTLTMKVTIPEIITFSAKVLTWEAGKAFEPKKATLKIADGATVKMGKIEASSEAIKTELKETAPTPPKQYELVITPTAEARGVVIVKLHTENADGTARTYQVLACFPTPKASPPAKAVQR